jgi:CIC family chloride channel protein
MDLSPQDARIAVTVGVGAGIGAIFRAPLGGAVLGTELLYRDDLEPEALLPSLVASIVGFSVFGAVEGFTPISGPSTHRSSTIPSSSSTTPSSASSPGSWRASMPAASTQPSR